MRPVLVALALLAIPLAGCLGGSDGDGSGAPGEAPAPGSGEAAPAWRFTDTDGVERSNATAAGTPTVLFFMATWCSTCMSKASWLDDAHREYGDRVTFYTIGQDPTESNADLERWKGRFKNDWPHGIDEGRAVQRTFGIRQQSSFALLDADGKLLQTWGYPGASESDLKGAIDRALAAGGAAT